MKIFAVGIGPGDLELLTPQARRVLEMCTAVVGYKPYLEQIAPLLEGKKVISGVMRQEVERCRLALEEALAGEVVSVVSSGDSGVYGMAGLLLELTGEARYAEIEVEVIPGITAATACASLVGAPFMNDFAVVSLSDLLTPPEVVRKRLRALAAADMPVALYNPATKQRRAMLDFAIAEFRRAGGEDLPCAVISDAFRPVRKITVTVLKDFPFDEVKMTSLVILGSSRTVLREGKMFNLRGYGEKYGVGQ